MLRYLSLAGICLLIVFTSCGQPEPLSQEGMSAFQLLLTDAPADEASALTVNFGAIKLVSDEESESGVTTVSSVGGSFDVLQLQNGKTDLLADMTIAEGSYSQLRVVIESATITVEGQVKPITIPSGAQSGLKIAIEPPLRALAGQASAVTLDFNARRVIQTGNGAYKMSPTAIRAVSTSGTLEGRLISSNGEPLEKGLISISDSSGNAVTEASSDSKGTFKIITLVEGRYTVKIDLDGYVSQTFNNVAVLANTTTGLTQYGNITLLTEDEVIRF